MTKEKGLLKVIFFLFLIKECYMAVMGTKTLVKTKVNEGAKWYGKVNTTIFYVVMVVLVLFLNISQTVANLLILCCGCFMALSFVMYARYYHVLQEKEARKGRKLIYAEYGKEVC
jgi:cardiolipin synthase